MLSKTSQRPVKPLHDNLKMVLATLSSTKNKAASYLKENECNFSTMSQFCFVFLHYKEALMSKVSGKLVHLSLTTLLWCRMAATEDVIASTKVEKLDCVERLITLNILTLQNNGSQCIFHWESPTSIPLCRWIFYCAVKK